MFCTQCGFKLEDSDLFCARCGKPTRADAPPPPEAPRKKLARQMSRKKIGGVCAGLADYLDTDVTLVRILTILAALLTGVGLVAYIVAWIVMPADHGPAPAPSC